MKIPVLLLIALLSFGAFAQAQTTAFTYQGHLKDGVQSANGSLSMKFRLYDAETDGNQIGEEKTALVTFTNGAFTVSLDFGSDAFPAGGDRWLEVQVGSVTLSPRQKIGSVPYAARAITANQADALSSVCNPCVNDSHISSISGGKVSGAVANATNAVNAVNATNATNAANAVNAANAGNANFAQDAAKLSGKAADEYLLKTDTVQGTFKWQSVSGATQAQPNNGYVADGASQVTITLPASPNVGDIVRVTGNGAGGWKVSFNAGQYVPGTSSDPTVWTPHESDRSWYSVASSADGTKLIAVVNGGQIYTSTDSGVSWTPRESSRNWFSVASSSDGTKLVALNNGGQIYTSTDSGASWTPRESSRGWYSVASSADGAKLVAVVPSGQIYTSTDSGANWTPRESDRSWVSVASSADGTKLVAVVLGGQIYTSTDSGVSWTPRESGRNWFSVASSSDGTKLIAVESSGQIYTSTDSGINWTAREINRQWLSVASSADGTKLVAVVNNGRIYTSTDSGVSWTAREINRNWYSVASSADGTKLIAVVPGGQIYINTPNPTPGYITGTADVNVELQYVGGGKFKILLASGGPVTLF